MLSILTRKQKLCYGLGDLGSNLVYAGIGIFIMIYWTDVAMIDPATAGTILLISRVFDGFSDVYFGRMVDKTTSKHGKARPWLLWLAIPFAISAMLTFWTPASSETINVIYAFVSYNISMLIYTAINIPYGVLTAKMTADPVERGKLGVMRSIGALLGMAIISGSAPILIQPLGYTLSFLAVGIVAAIFIFITFIGSCETVGNSEEKTYSLKEGIGVLRQNTPWLIMLVSGTVIFAALTIRLTATAYYATYNVENPELVGPLTIITIPGMVLGIALCEFCFKRFGKINTAVYSAFLGSVAAIVFYILISINNSLEIIYIYLFITAIPQGICLAGFFPMIADTIEYGQWKTNIRVEGLTYSAASIGTKVGGGIGAAFVGWILSGYGFDATINQQTNETLSSIEFLFLWTFPIGLFLFALILRCNTVDRDYAQISAKIKRKSS